MGGASTAGAGLAPGQFGPFGGRVWLNTAHQGPLPRAAVDAAAEAAVTKAVPHRMADEAFTEVPERLRRLLARLVGGAPDEVVLGDSTSHGLHLVANGLAWRPEDEVLLVRGDYPATTLPWLRLADRGVRARWLEPDNATVSAQELAAAITPRTKVLALTWVDSFTGHAADLHALGLVCRNAGVLLVVNASQAIGVRPLDVSSTPVDAVVACGYKWLCRPYGTGCSWLRARSCSSSWSRSRRTGWRRRPVGGSTRCAAGPRATTSVSARSTCSVPRTSSTYCPGPPPSSSSSTSAWMPSPTTTKFWSTS